MQCLREKIDRIDAVVYTHSHTDHMMGFDDLRPFCANGRDLPVYASAETMADLRARFQFCFQRTEPRAGLREAAPAFDRRPVFARRDPADAAAAQAWTGESERLPLRMCGSEAGGVFERLQGGARSQ